MGAKKDVDTRSDATSDREHLTPAEYEPPPACYERGRKIEYWSATYGQFISGRVKDWHASTNTLTVGFAGAAGERQRVPFSLLRPPLRPEDRCEVLMENAWVRQKEGWVPEVGVEIEGRSFIFFEVRSLA